MHPAAADRKITMTQTLRELIEFSSTTAEKSFAVRQCYDPMWHAITADGAHKIILQTIEDKDAQLALVRAAFELFDVRAYVFITEAWSLTDSSRDEAERNALVEKYTKEGIAQNPDRVEILYFQAEDRTGLLSAYRNIIRQPQRRPRLGKLKFQDMQGWSAEGRIMGLLPRPADASVQ
jgi:hypothetical protein